VGVSLRHLWLGLGGEPRGTLWLPDVPVSHVVIDSRDVQHGDVFVALAGEHQDGHQFVGDALQRGAVAAIVSQVPEGVAASVLSVGDVPTAAVPTPVLLVVPDTLAGLQRAAAYWRSLFRPRVVGITGSVGKTSTKEMVAAVLRQRFNTLWNPASYNNEIGLPLTLLRLSDEHEALVVEMGAYVPGDIAALCAVAHPDVGVVTNVGVSHLERMGTVERIWQAKSELVRALPADGVAILNWDDEGVRRMADVTSARVFRYGLTPEADLWASDVQSLGLEGMRFVLHHRDASLHVRLPWLGQHSVHTALRAAAVGLAYGLDWEEIVRGLQDTQAQLRVVVVPGLQRSKIIDDTYNASPESTLAALNLLADLNGTRMAILGDMLELGSYEEPGHRKVGARAAEVTDWLVGVGPRARWIVEEAVAHGMDPAQVRHVGSVDEAVAVAKSWLEPGAMVLVKASRAMGLERVVAALRAEVED